MPPNSTGGRGPAGSGLVHESRRFDLLEKANPLEDRVCRRRDRFPNVVPGMDIALEDEDLSVGLRQQRGQHGACRPAPDDYYVVTQVRHCHGWIRLTY